MKPLIIVKPETAMVQQDVEDHIFAHALGEIRIYDPDNGNIRQLRITHDAVDPGSHGEDHFEVGVLRKLAVRRIPRHNKADIGDVARFAMCLISRNDWRCVFRSDDLRQTGDVRCRR